MKLIECPKCKSVRISTITRSEEVKYYLQSSNGLSCINRGLSECDAFCYCTDCGKCFTLDHKRFAEYLNEKLTR